MHYNDLNEEGKQWVQDLLKANEGKNGVIAGYCDGSVKSAEKDMERDGVGIGYVVKEGNYYRIYKVSGERGLRWKYISPLQGVPGDKSSPKCPDCIPASALEAHIQEIHKITQEFLEKLGERVYLKHREQELQGQIDTLVAELEQVQEQLNEN